MWFVAGVALFPMLQYLASVSRPPTALKAMGWVSHYEETKGVSTLLPDFGYSLRFPGDREKFENFVKKMNLQGHKVSDDDYGFDSNEGGERARFMPEKRGYEIEYRAYGN